LRKVFYLIIFLISTSVIGQLLELDYGSPLKKESLFRISLFKQFVGGINTLGHIDISTEALDLNYSTSGSFLGGLSVLGTTSIFKGNQDDKKNNLSPLLNPMGGTVNGSLHATLSLKKKEKSSLGLSTRMGLKWIEGTPLGGFESRFLNGYGILGGVYQRLLFEDAPENQRIDFWAYPHFMYSNIGAADLNLFFKNELESNSYSYGLQMGVEFNRKLRLVFLINQFINTPDSSSLGKAVLRFTLAHRFKT
jgi:hypothetical protein